MLAFLSLILFLFSTWVFVTQPAKKLDLSWVPGYMAEVKRIQAEHGKDSPEMREYNKSAPFKMEALILYVLLQLAILVNWLTLLVIILAIFKDRGDQNLGLLALAFWIVTFLRAIPAAFRAVNKQESSFNPSPIWRFLAYLPTVYLGYLFLVLV